MRGERDGMAAEKASEGEGRVGDEGAKAAKVTARLRFVRNKWSTRAGDAEDNSQSHSIPELCFSLYGNVSLSVCLRFATSSSSVQYYI